MIKNITFEGLNGRLTRTLNFHPDINVLTGRNGCGKTTVLKLLWYLISGNLERIPSEIPFQLISIDTEHFSISIAKKEDKRGRARFEIEFTASGMEPVKHVATERVDSVLNSVNHPVVELSRNSVFFSTFRRIEGGFETLHDTGIDARHGRPRSQIDDAMSNLAARMSVVDPLDRFRHIFVAAISTKDITNLLTMEYALVSTETNAAHTAFSREILDKLSESGVLRPASTTDLITNSEAIQLLKAIGTRAAYVAEQQERLLRPFSMLSELATRVFKYPGIRFSESITLGEGVDSVRSEILSAGEKQMLSFLSYNAFIRGGPFFIDEPELSLHVDWQRILVPTLLSQKSQNQYFIATHSPFIYSRYPDHEIQLDDDRGHSVD